MEVVEAWGVCLWLILCDGEAEATFRQGGREGERLAFILGVCQLRNPGCTQLATGGKEDEEEQKEMRKIEREIAGKRGERLREEYGGSCENVRRRRKMRGMFFVRSDPASTTPKMFLSFGDKQARK